jgi:hypothetical protein
MISVFVNSEIRKVEYLKDDPEFEDVLLLALRGTTIEKKSVVGVSYDNKSIYGVYYTQPPKNTGLDLSKYKTESIGNNLIQVKVTKPLNNIEVKVYSYYKRRDENLNHDYLCIGSADFIGKDKYTTYYIKDKKMIEEFKALSPNHYMEFLATNEFYSFTTENEIKSLESTYKQKTPQGIPCH